MKKTLTSFGGVAVLCSLSTFLPPRNGTETPAESERVSAGRVHWHESREAAQAASRVSGKPVLLFQMLGRLDEEFC